jgi:transposase
MGSTRRRFTQEYKDQAVAFVIDDRRSIVEVANNIGVHQVTLGKWVRKARRDENPEGPGDSATEKLSGVERAELERLRAENMALKKQVEFAKKVATWFAKDQQ